MTPEPNFTRGRSHGKGLALIGYRGSGKSTVGRLVAERLSRTFLDADLEIEARAGKSIAAIFAESGEPAFRDWEERTLAQLIAAHPRSVIATGGGAVIRELNRKRLREFGFVVWLTATPSVLAERLAADHRTLPGRPALSALGTLDEIREILEVRTPLYRELADAVIDTNEHQLENIVATIVDTWVTAS
jgi:shikimate kinase